MNFFAFQSNQKVNARWTTDEQLLAVQGSFSSCLSKSYLKYDSFSYI